MHPQCLRAGPFEVVIGDGCTLLTLRLRFALCFELGFTLDFTLGSTLGFTLGCTLCFTLCCTLRFTLCSASRYSCPMEPRVPLGPCWVPPGCLLVQMAPDPIQSSPVIAVPVQSSPVQSGAVLGSPVQSSAVKRNTTHSNPVQSSRVQSSLFPVAAQPSPVQSRKQCFLFAAGPQVHRSTNWRCEGS